MITVKQDTFSVVKLNPEGQGTRDKGQGVLAKLFSKSAKPRSIVLKIDSFVVVKPVVSESEKPQIITSVAQTIALKEDTVLIVKAEVKEKEAVKEESKSLAFEGEDTRAKGEEKAEVVVAENPPAVVSEVELKTEETGLPKEELLAALDSLAKLRREQERIVEYLTLRITKKPIKIFTYADSVSVEIFDSGTHDKDSVSVIFNKSLVVDKHELKVDKPIKFKVKIGNDVNNNQMVVVAENLGTYPPNTAVMIITDNYGKREEVILSKDLTSNEVVMFVKIDKPAEKPSDKPAAKTSNE